MESTLESTDSMQTSRPLPQIPGKASGGIHHTRPIPPIPGETCETSNPVTILESTDNMQSLKNEHIYETLEDAQSHKRMHHRTPGPLTIGTKETVLMQKVNSRKCE